MKRRMDKHKAAERLQRLLLKNLERGFAELRKAQEHRTNTRLMKMLKQRLGRRELKRRSL